jgi:hypothetical protein
MKPGSKLVSGLLLTATLALSASANATILTFTDRDAFNAAVGAVDLIDFEQFGYAGVCPRSPVGGPPCSLTVGDVTFTGRAESYVGAEYESGPQLVTSPADGLNPSIGLISSFIPYRPGDFTIDFSGAALGFDLITTGGLNDLYALLFREGDGTLTQFDALGSRPFGKFFGAISDIGFTDVSIFSNGVSGGANFLVDNVATAAGAKSVPEPSTLALLGAGMALLAVKVRRRRGNQNR